MTEIDQMAHVKITLAVINDKPDSEDKKEAVVKRETADLKKEKEEDAKEKLKLKINLKKTIQDRLKKFRERLAKTKKIRFSFKFRWSGIQRRVIRLSRRVRLFKARVRRFRLRRERKQKEVKKSVTMFDQVKKKKIADDAKKADEDFK